MPEAVLSQFSRLPATLRPPHGTSSAPRAAAPQAAAPRHRPGSAHPGPAEARGYGEPGEELIPPGACLIPPRARLLPPAAGGNAAGRIPQETCGCVTTRGGGAARLGRA